MLIETSSFPAGCSNCLLKIEGCCESSAHLQQSAGTVCSYASLPDGAMHAVAREACFLYALGCLSSPFYSYHDADCVAGCLPLSSWTHKDYQASDTRAFYSSPYLCKCKGSWDRVMHG